MPLFKSAIQSFILCSLPFLPVLTSITVASGHHLCWQSHCFNNMRSSTLKFLLLSFHLCLHCKVYEKTMFKNSSVICCTHLYLLQRYRSCLVKTPGGGIITLVFMVNRLLGENSIWLLISLKVSTVSGLELTADSTSTIKVSSALSFNDLPFVLVNPSKTLLSDGIWCFHTHSICDAPGGFLCHITQSVPFPCKFLSFLWSISFSAFCNLLFAPTKLVPLSDHIDWTAHLLAWNLWGSMINISANSVGDFNRVRAAGETCKESSRTFEFWLSLSYQGLCKHMYSWVGEWSSLHVLFFWQVCHFLNIWYWVSWSTLTLILLCN